MRTERHAMAIEEREIKRLMIRGTVQGIGFRVWVEREALRLGLDGWVRNRRDGAVEVVLAGPPPAVVAMVERCWKGPRLAEVQSIDVEDAAPLDLGYRRPGEDFSLIATE
jgi:acylphosphatase